MKRTSSVFLFFLLVTISAFAGADHYDDFLAAASGKPIDWGSFSETAEGDVAPPEFQSIEDYENDPNHDKYRYIMLPNSGFIVVWSDVTILDDNGNGNAIQPHSDDVDSFVLADASLVSLASEAISGNKKTLIVDRGENGTITDLSIGRASSFLESRDSAADSIISLSQEEEHTRPLNYIVAGPGTPTAPA